MIIKATANAILLAPESIHWEIGNAFSAMLKRKRILFEQAEKALEIYAMIPIRFVKVDLGEALAIAAKYDIFAYDAYLLQCAKNFKATLLTLDNQLANVAKKEGITISEVRS
jgi:predicted nucleic acid-binding protein